MPRTVVSKSGDIVELLKQAAAEGRIVLMLPAASRYQPATPSSQDTPEQTLTAALCRLFGLRHGESRALVPMVQWGFVSRERLHAAISRDASPDTGIETVGVTVSSLRRKLRPFGIGIVTLHGLGCRLGETDRDKIREMLAEAGAELVDAITPAGNAEKTKIEVA